MLPEDGIEYLFAQVFSLAHYVQVIVSRTELKFWQYSKHGFF